MASSASPVTSLGASQRQKAEREGVGKGDGEEDLPAERWWLPQPGKPGVQLPVNRALETVFALFLHKKPKIIALYCRWFGL